MALFKIYKGPASNLGKAGNVTQYAQEGFAYFTQDDGKFYIDVAGDGTTEAVLGNNRLPLNAEQADKDAVGNVINETYVTIDLNDSEQGNPSSVNADTLGGVLASDYALKSDLDNLTGSNIDLSNYVTRTELEEYVPDIDLTEYYTKTETDDKYALKSDIQSGAVRLDFTVTLPASGWSNTSPYSQSVTVSGISETDWPQMAQDLSAATDDTVDNLEKNYAYIKYGETALNTITFYCLKGKPAIDLILIGQVFREGE